MLIEIKNYLNLKRNVQNMHLYTHSPHNMLGFSLFNINVIVQWKFYFNFGCVYFRDLEQVYHFHWHAGIGFPEIHFNEQLEKSFDINSFWEKEPRYKFKAAAQFWESERRSDFEIAKDQLPTMDWCLLLMCKYWIWKDCF